jgi:hypothetical protein
MACSCIRGVYDFDLRVIDTETLVYKDLSDWMDDHNYIHPVSYDIYITIPASSSKKKITVQVDNLNKIKEFGKLKDGIYCFETESCGVKYKKSIGIFPNAECCIKQAWATLGEQFADKIREVENYLKDASVNAEYNNIQIASKNLLIAQKLLENIKCDCTC